MDLRRFYPPRREEARKGDYGRVLVVGGSGKYTGCVALNALAALRAGADLAVVLAPRRAADVAATFAPDLITIPIPGEALNAEGVARAKAEAASADALVIGCGMHRSPASHEAIRSLLAASKAPAVADAEALHALAGREEMLRDRRIVLTPHAGEFRWLTGVDLAGMDEPSRVEAVRSAAERLGAVILLKGARDVVSDGRRVHVDRAGSPYMTKGGYGDVVAGILGALLARGRGDAFEAAVVAAYLVGEAGRRNGEKLREGALASEAIGEIPGVIRDALDGAPRTG